MKKSALMSAGHGLFKVYWKSGGYSLASIGSLPSGERWIAPTNWVNGATPITNRIHKGIKSLSLIEKRGRTGKYYNIGGLTKKEFKTLKKILKNIRCNATFSDEECYFLDG